MVAFKDQQTTFDSIAYLNVSDPCFLLLIVPRFFSGSSRDKNREAWMKRKTQILYHLLHDFQSERTDAGLPNQLLADLETFC